MCLIIGKYVRKRIATEKIVAYKILEGLESPHQMFKYQLKKLYKTNIKFCKDYTPYDNKDAWALDDKYSGWRRGNKVKSISEGFHGMMTKQRAESAKSIYNHQQIYQVTIPKGAEYYVNCSGLFVSNKIIINKKL